MPSLTTKYISTGEFKKNATLFKYWCINIPDYFVSNSPTFKGIIHNFINYHRKDFIFIS